MGCENEKREGWGGGGGGGVEWLWRIQLSDGYVSIRVPNFRIMLYEIPNSYSYVQKSLSSGDSSSCLVFCDDRFVRFLPSVGY